MVQLLAHIAVTQAFGVGGKMGIFPLPPLHINCTNLITKHEKILEPSYIPYSQDGHRDSHSVVVTLAFNGGKPHLSHLKDCHLT